MTITVHYWTDFCSPYSYMGVHSIKKRIADDPELANIKLVPHAYETEPRARADGRFTIKHIYPYRYHVEQWEADQHFESVARLAKKHGIDDMNYESSLVTNSRDAHRLAKYARKHRVDIEEAIMHANFCENRNIGDKEVLADIAEEAGLDREEVKQMLEGDEFRDMVVADETYAFQNKIGEVPLFVIGKKRFDGEACVDHMIAYLKALPDEE